MCTQVLHYVSHMHMKLLHLICLPVPASSVSLDPEGHKAFRPLKTVLFQWHVAKAAYTDAAIKALMPSHSFWWNAMLV